MTCNERLETLLNQAGQTISDLPKVNGIGMPYRIDKYESLLKEASDFTQFNAPAGFEVFNVIQYALHLTDVIDCLETALENVCGERDYLKQQFRSHGYRDCKSCAHRYDCEQLSDYCCGYVFAGVPVDWSVDDDL